MELGVCGILLSADYADYRFWISFFSADYADYADYKSKSIKGLGLNILMSTHHRNLQQAFSQPQDFRS